MNFHCRRERHVSKPSMTTLIFHILFAIQSLSWFPVKFITHWIPIQQPFAPGLIVSSFNVFRLSPYLSFNHAYNICYLGLQKVFFSSLKISSVYTNPPQLVIEVLSAVCVLFQKEPTWPNAKLMLADTNFLKQLIEFDKDSVSNRVSTILL